MRVIEEEMEYLDALARLKQWRAQEWTRKLSEIPIAVKPKGPPRRPDLPPTRHFPRHNRRDGI